MNNEIQSKPIEERLRALETRLHAVESRLSQLEQPKRDNAKLSPLSENLPAGKPASNLSQFAVTLVHKQFHKANYSLGDAGDRIDFVFLFKSHLKKDVRAFKGVVVIKDLFDQVIMRLTLTHEEGVRAEGTAEWRGGIKFNQFTESHQRLLTVEQKDMQVSFELESVIYADGTRETFGV